MKTGKNQDDQVKVRAGTLPAHAKVAPLMRFNETDTAFELRLSLPGVKQDGVKVQIERNTLMVEAHRDTPDRRDMKCIRQEIPMVDYCAAYEVPEDVDTASVGARLANGILEITLKKQEAAKPRQIEIK